MASDTRNLQDWIGRTERARETLTPEIIRRFRATLDLPDSPEAPELVHLCLAPAVERPGRLGRDGHPAKGGFLPPVDLPVRMWAGGRYQFHDALRAGDPVTRDSRIADIQPKQGRSGRLCFVTVIHDISTPRGLAVTERHDIVYREEGRLPQSPDIAPQGTYSQTAEITPVTLFRYSALTFNGHRIHYDHAYATGVEGYRGVVIHGPLLATLLYHFACRILGRPPAIFDYRNHAPLCIGDKVVLHADNAGDGLRLWAAAHNGPKAIDGRVTASR